jgi:hypothetical protein
VDVLVYVNITEIIFFLVDCQVATEHEAIGVLHPASPIGIAKTNPRYVLLGLHCLQLFGVS